MEDSLFMVESPCAQKCRLVSGFCSGCDRSLEEIAAWSKMSEGEKSFVLYCLMQRRAMRDSHTLPQGDQTSQA
ncbi:MAG: DUF1289 domain-containing protein [Armatimonadetes bacterium]|nr:DUF1289 domain-containing protein [Armatimonadota bacterium]